MSGVRCVGGTYHIYIFFLFSIVLELVREGQLSTGPTPSSFFYSVKRALTRILSLFDFSVGNYFLH